VSGCDKFFHAILFVICLFVCLFVFCNWVLCALILSDWMKVREMFCLRWNSTRGWIFVSYFINWNSFTTHGTYLLRMPLLSPWHRTNWFKVWWWRYRENLVAFVIVLLLLVLLLEILSSSWILLLDANLSQFITVWRSQGENQTVKHFQSMKFML
jgi:hypothetical protein